MFYPTVDLTKLTIALADNPNVVPITAQIIAFFAVALRSGFAVDPIYNIPAITKATDDKEATTPPTSSTIS